MSGTLVFGFHRSLFLEVSPRSVTQAGFENVWAVWLCGQSSDGGCKGNRKNCISLLLTLSLAYEPRASEGTEPTREDAGVLISCIAVVFNVIYPRGGGGGVKGGMLRGHVRGGMLRGGVLICFLP